MTVTVSFAGPSLVQLMFEEGNLTDPAAVDASGTVSVALDPWDREGGEGTHDTGGGPVAGNFSGDAHTGAEQQFTAWPTWSADTYTSLFAITDGGTANVCLADTGSWAVTVNTVARTVSSVHRRTVPIRTRRLSSTPTWASRRRHLVTLTLASPLSDGDVLAITPPSENPIAATFGPSVVSEAVHVCHLGYPLAGPKMGYVGLWLGHTSGGADGTTDAALSTSTGWELIRTSDDAVVDSGTLELAKDGAAEHMGGANFNGCDIYRADFSDHDAEGTYRLEVEGVGASVPFAISVKPYERVMRMAARALFFQRSGCAITASTGEGITRPRNGHPADGLTVFQTDVMLGRHDQGFNSASDVFAALLAADSAGGGVTLGETEYTAADSLSNSANWSPLASNMTLDGELTIASDGSFQQGQLDLDTALTASTQYQLSVTAESVTGGNIDLIMAGDGTQTVINNLAEGTNEAVFVATGDFPQINWNVAASNSAVITAVSIREVTDVTPLSSNADAWGGWHDAGDWDRRIQHMDTVYTLAQIVQTFPEARTLRLNLPETGKPFSDAAVAAKKDGGDNGDGTTILPDLIHEALWGISLWRRTQGVGGGIIGGVEYSLDGIEGSVSWNPVQKAFAYAEEEWAAYQFAGAAAKLGTVITELGDDTLGAALIAEAQDAWDWAEAELGNGDAYSEHDNAEMARVRIRAAGSLYEATGDAGARAVFEAYNAFDPQTGLGLPDEGGSLGTARGDYAFAALDYVRAGQRGRTVNSSVTSEITTWCSNRRSVDGATRLGEDFGLHNNALYGPGTSWFRFGPASNWWAGRSALTVIADGSVAAGHRDEIVEGMWFALGCNPSNVSLIQGVGVRQFSDPLVNGPVFPGQFSVGPAAGDLLSYETDTMGDSLFPKGDGDWPHYARIYETRRAVRSSEFGIKSNMMEWLFACAFAAPPVSDITAQPAMEYRQRLVAGRKTRAMVVKADPLAPNDVPCEIIDITVIENNVHVTFGTVHESIVGGALVAFDGIAMPRSARVTPASDSTVIAQGGIDWIGPDLDFDGLAFVFLPVDANGRVGTPKGAGTLGIPALDQIMIEGATEVPGANPTDPPSYEALEDDVLTVTWRVTGYPVPTVAVQWMRDGVDISGATSASYTIVGADVGADIAARLEASNSLGTATAQSETVDVIDPSIAIPEGAQLAIRVGSNDPTDDTFGYDPDWANSGINGSLPVAGYVLHDLHVTDAVNSLTLTIFEEGGSTGVQIPGVAGFTVSFVDLAGFPSPVPLTWDAGAAAYVSGIDNDLETAMAGAAGNTIGVSGLPVGTVPSFSAAPAVTPSGTQDLETPLTLTYTATGLPTPSVAIEWSRNGDPLGDTDTSHTPGAGLTGSYNAEVTLTNTVGSVTVISNTVTIADAGASPPPAPDLTDLAAAQTEWVDEEGAQTWRVNFGPLSSYSGGVITEMEWTNLRDTHPNYGTDPTFEPCEFDDPDWKNLSVVWTTVIPENLRVRVKVSGNSAWSAPSPLIAPLLALPQPTDPPDPGPTNVSFVKAWSPRYPGQKAAGLIGGKADQTLVGGDWKDGRLVYAGDMNGYPWSEDNGHTWQQLYARGLWSGAGLSAYFPDPNDSDKILICGGHANDGWLSERHGIFYSESAGRFWEQVHDFGASFIPNGIVNFKVQMERRQWFTFPTPLNGYALFQWDTGSYQNPQVTPWVNGEARLLRSTNGGRTWSTLTSSLNAGANNTSSSSGKFAAIYGIWHDPTNPSRLFMGTDEGCFVNQAVLAGAGDANWSLIPGSPALKCRSFYISPSGLKVYVSYVGGNGSQGGIWKSTSGAGSFSNFSRILDTRPAAQGVAESNGECQMAVSPVDDQRIYVMLGRRATPIVPGRYSANGGNSWQTVVVDPEHTDGVGRIEHPAGDAAIGLFSPSVATDLIVNRANMYRSRGGDPTDLAWNNSGYNALGCRDIFIPRDNSQYMICAIADSQAQITYDGGDTALEYNFPRNTGIGAQHGADYLAHSGNTSLYSSQTGFMHGSGPQDRTTLLCIGRVTGDTQMIVGRANGQRDRAEGANLYRYDFVQRDPSGNGAVVYASRRRSTNYGLAGSWGGISGGGSQGVVEVSRQNQGVVWSASVSTSGSISLWRGTGAHTGSVSWTFVATINAGGGENAQGSAAKVCAIHPTNDEIIFVAVYDEVYRVNAGAGATVTSLNFRDQYAALEPTFPWDRVINALCSDPKDPNILHVGMFSPGTISIMRTLNGGSTWEDASGAYQYRGGNLQSAITAGSGSVNISANAAGEYPSGQLDGKYPVARIDAEFVKFTRSGSTITFVERGAWGSIPAAHAAGAQFIYMARRNYFPCITVDALESSPCGTVVGCSTGEGLYALKPPAGYSPLAGFTSGDMFDRMIAPSD